MAADPSTRCCSHPISPDQINTEAETKAESPMMMMMMTMMTMMMMMMMTRREMQGQMMSADYGSTAISAGP
jgi:hypothetical protein